MKNDAAPSPAYVVSVTMLPTAKLREAKIEGGSIGSGARRS